MQNILQPDGSGKGIGVVLNQRWDEGEVLIVSASRSLNDHEAKYPAWKGELVAVTWAVRLFRHYLHGRKFDIVTDHRPLLWLLRATELSGHHARWCLILQEFSFRVQHRPGLSHQIADLPSREPLPSSADSTGAQFDSRWTEVTHPLPAVVDR